MCLYTFMSDIIQKTFFNDVKENLNFPEMRLIGIGPASIAVAKEM